MTQPLNSARNLGLVRCVDCSLVVAGIAAGRCPRCGSRLYSRKPHSLSRTWALVISAWVFILPANLYPIMTVVYFGDGTPDTILSGVIRLAADGMLPIAVVVFVASIMVPILKLLSIMFLLLVVQFQWRLNQQRCTLLFRLIEVIGAWSMLDLFIISILVTLGDLGEIASVIAGPAASAFALVVVLTLLAAMSFDARLIWDLQEQNDG